VSRKLKKYLAMEYPIIVRRCAAGYRVTSPLLPCLGEGDTLDKAYGAFEQSKGEYFAQLLAQGREREIKPPPADMRLSAEKIWVLFLVKCFIAFIFLLSLIEMVRLRFGDLLKSMWAKLF
jgi:hypothetical protein